MTINHPMGQVFGAFLLGDKYVPDVAFIVCMRNAGFGFITPK
jgi:hypothetical protein